MSRADGTRQFQLVLEEMNQLHLKKGRDYGTNRDPFTNVRNSEAFGLPAWVGAMLRAQDKMVRIQKAARQVLSGEELSMANEGLEDSLIDLANYAVIGLVLLRQDSEGDRE